MPTSKSLLCVLSLVSSACAANPSDSKLQGTLAPVDARAAFATLCSASGSWTTQAEPGGPSETPVGARFEFKTTSNGSAVVETLFAGTPHEMVTVYALHGDQLHATHFCAGGNQPHYQAYPGPKPGVLLFECPSRDGFCSSGEAHMHRGELEIGAHAIVERWFSRAADGSDEMHNVVIRLARG